jgi:hypothetical protein
MPKEAVCLVFEKVNTDGRRLDAFELLTAIHAADGFELRKDWYGDAEAAEPRGRQRRLARHNLLKDLASVDVLQAISLIHTHERRSAEQQAGKQGKELPPVSCTRSAVLDLPEAAYKR